MWFYLAHDFIVLTGDLSSALEVGGRNPCILFDFCLENTLRSVDSYSVFAVSGLVFVFDRVRLCRGAPGALFFHNRILLFAGLASPKSEGAPLGFGGAGPADKEGLRGCRLLLRRGRAGLRLVEAVHLLLDQRRVGPELAKSLRVMPDQFCFLQGMEAGRIRLLIGALRFQHRVDQSRADCAAMAILAFAWPSSPHPPMKFTLKNRVLCLRAAAQPAWTSAARQKRVCLS